MFQIILNYLDGIYHHCKHLPTAFHLKKSLKAISTAGLVRASPCICWRLMGVYLYIKSYGTIGLGKHACTLKVVIRRIHRFTTLATK